MSMVETESPRWGAKNRDIKGQAILMTLKHFIDKPLDQLSVMDIGCGNGGIAATLAPHFDSTIGMDVESWPHWVDFKERHKNLNFINMSAENISIDDASMDVIICNQVYEHVPNPKKLISEIERLLKPGGYCYFAGPNLLFPIEPHVFWPFVHWFPRDFAIRFMKRLGSTAILDAYSADYWTLKRWLHKFVVYNALPYVLKNPRRYNRSSCIWNLASLAPISIYEFLTFVSPAFIFVLQKPPN